MKKGSIFYSVIWLLTVMLYHVIVVTSLVVMQKFDWNVLIAYLTVMFCFIGQLACALVTLLTKSGAKQLYHIPVVIVDYIGLLVLLVIGSICMFVGGLPMWVCLLLCLLPLILSVIITVVAKAAASTVGDVDTQIKEQTDFIKGLTSNAEAVMMRAGTPAVKANAKKVYEAVRYSDPMSTEALAPIESAIRTRFSSFASAVATGDEAAVEALASELTVMIADRNRQCQRLK